MDARQWNEYYAANKAPWTRPDDDVVAETAELPLGRALDLGAGEGANSIWLARQGWEVTAVDQAPAAIDTLVQLAAGESLAIRGVVADVAEYRADAPYDLVLICYMHLPSDTRTRLLTNAAAALAPDGVLLLIGLSPPDEASPLGGPTGAGLPNALIATPAEALAASGDFTIERYDVRRRVIGGTQGDINSDVMLIRARRTVSDDGDTTASDRCAER